MKVMKMVVSVFVLATLLSFSCTKRGDGVPGANQYRFNENMVVDGLTRTYLVNLPPDYDEASSFPVVIALHGGGGSAKQFESSTGLTVKANEEHFVIVYPDGYRGPGNVQTWNAGGCCGASQMMNIDDVKFISTLIDKLIATYKIDPKRIYLTGHSNGGMLCYRLASELANKITAIGVNSCTMVLTAPIHPSRPVPILHIHSTKDTNVPLNGGIGTGVSGVYFPPVDSVLRVWSAIDACGASPQTITYPGYTFRNWTGCKPDITIEYYLTDDGGHSWPGGNHHNPFADPPSKAIDANSVLWNFFKRFQLK